MLTCAKCCLFNIATDCDSFGFHTHLESEDISSIKMLNFGVTLEYSCPTCKQTRQMAEIGYFAYSTAYFLKV